MTPEDQGSSPHLGTACPSCGITVPVGYRRCPKCHGGITGGDEHVGDASAARVQGGTSVPSGGGRSTFWMVVVASVAVLAAVVLFVVSGGDSEDEAVAEPPPPTPAEVEPQEAAAPTAPPPAPQPVIAAAPDEGPEALAAGAAALESRLDSGRVWATVEVDGDQLAVRSAYCEGEGMNAAIASVAGLLLEMGVSAVSCYERHGPKVFERALIDTDQQGGDAGGP